MKKVTPKTEEYMEPSSMVGHPSKGKEPRKFYPHLRLEHEFFPETKKWEVGKTYKIELEVKMTGLSIAKFQNDSEFDITGYDLEGASEDKESE